MHYFSSRLRGISPEKIGYRRLYPAIRSLGQLESSPSLRGVPSCRAITARTRSSYFCVGPADEAPVLDFRAETSHPVVFAAQHQSVEGAVGLDQ
jgi:hypothetical protein